MAEMAACDPHLRVLEFRKNFGQTAAMAAGIQAATGDVIVTMDGDLQNDPLDIPKMLDKIEEGYDLVHGWRKDRKDAWLSRKLPSVLANRLISRVTDFPVHDLGCTLKAIRREIAQELELFGEMHRFIPILARCRGARCTEIVTRHHPAPVRAIEIRHLPHGASAAGSAHGEVFNSIPSQPDAIVRHVGRGVLVWWACSRGRRPWA